MDQGLSDELEMYVKWSKDLDLDYDIAVGVDDPDGLVQISRDGLQEQIDKDVSVFSEGDLNQLKRMDLFILENIKNSSRWLSADPSKPVANWWWHLDRIQSGELKLPNIEQIFEGYFAFLKGKK